MAVLTFLAHLPCLKIKKDIETFGGLSLYKLPFKYYDFMTIGAFERYASDYENTEPVFITWQEELDLYKPLQQESLNGALELKRPFQETATEVKQILPYYPLIQYMDNIVLDAWTVLSLACPMASLIHPNFSVRFIYVEGDEYFKLNDTYFHTYKIQGEADQEYLFAPEFHSDPITSEILRKAEGLYGLLKIIREQNLLNTALNSFLYTQTPIVSAKEQLILCVITLERLLLGNRVSGLRKNFANRLASFYSEPENSQEIESIARTLYDIRSAELHGKFINKPNKYIEYGYAPRILAEVICLLAKAVKKGNSLETILAGYGSENYKPLINFNTSLLHPKRAVDRLNKNKESMVLSMTSTMGYHEEKDKEYLWSPLIGMQVEENQTILLEALIPQVVMHLSAEELSQLEDRDIRNDGLNQLVATDRAFNRQIQHRAVLLTIGDTLKDQNSEIPIEDRLIKQVNNAVLALRLSGLHKFSDPMLLGKYFYRGTIRYRRATVLRQTVLTEYVEEPNQLTKEKANVAGQLLNLIVVYEQLGIHPHVRQVISEYHRSFNHRYLTLPVSANLAFASLEGILGPFGGQSNRPQLQEFVSIFGNGESFDWFKLESQNYRNDIAHGRWMQNEIDQLQHLWIVLGQVIVNYLAFLVSEKPVSNKPARAFRKRLTEITLNNKKEG